MTDCSVDSGSTFTILRAHAKLVTFKVKRPEVHTLPSHEAHTLSLYTYSFSRPGVDIRASLRPRLPADPQPRGHGDSWQEGDGQLPQRPGKLPTATMASPGMGMQRTRSGETGHPHCFLTWRIDISELAFPGLISPVIS